MEISRHAVFGRVLPILLFTSFCIPICFLKRAAANCECGYSATIGSKATPHVFTDLIETDFQALEDIAKDTDWVRQEFNLTAKRARGDFGEMFVVNNVYTDLGRDDDRNENNEGDAGLQLVVQTSPVDGMVPVAEIDSSRVDLRWGSFRAGIKVPDVPGTCAAFFWYFNDTQEIDMEFLSKDFHDNNSSYPVNLVLQSRQATANGFDAQKTTNFVTAYLPFNPTMGFHEYRIDFLPEQVIWYADDHLLAQMTGSAVPTSGGHIVLQHWSNGNPLWSGGPPARNAIMTVSHVRAYFNSTQAERQHDWATRCVNAKAPNAICAIPGFIFSDDRNPKPWLFSEQNNMTNNQTVYVENGGNSGLGQSLWPLLALYFFVSGWLIGV